MWQSENTRKFLENCMWNKMGNKSIDWLKLSNVTYGKDRLMRIVEAIG